MEETKINLADLILRIRVLRKEFKGLDLNKLSFEEISLIREYYNDAILLCQRTQNLSDVELKAFGLKKRSSDKDIEELENFLKNARFTYIEEEQ